MKTLLIAVGLCLSFPFAGYAQRDEIVRIKIPIQYNRLYNEELIKRLVIRPSLNKTIYVAAADTILNTLEVCGGNGVYYFGQGPTDHTPARYWVVTRLENELQYVYNKTNKPLHKQLIEAYYDGTSSADKCFTYKHDEPLMIQVIRLVDLNRRKVSSDKF